MVCDEVFRLTDRNKVKCWNAWKKGRRDRPSVSKDNYPSSIRPNWKKIRGLRK